MAGESRAYYSVDELVNKDIINSMTKILIIMTKTLGDIVLTTPIIDVLYKKFSATGDIFFIDFLVEKRFEEVLLGNPYLHRIVTFDKHAKGEEGFWNTVFKIRRERYDYIFDFICYPRSAWVVLFSGAKRKFGFDQKFRQMLYTDVAKRTPEKKYAVDFKMDLLKGLGIERGYRKTSLYIEQELVEKRRVELLDNGWNGKNRVVGVVVPNNHYKIKNWIFERYVKVIKRLAELDVFVVLVWGPGEEETAKALKKAAQKAIYLMRLGNVRSLAAMLKNFDAVLTTDSGSKHVAVAVDTPTVTIYGPTCRISWHAYGSDIHIPVYADGLECLACQKIECPKGSKECMERITTEEVFEKVKKLLETNYRRIEL